MDRKFLPRIKQNKVTSVLSPRSSSSACTPKRRLSVDSQAESLEGVQEISTPSDSTVSKETEKFVRRASSRKRNPEISTTLSTSSPHTNKRMCLFKVGTREV